MNGHGPELPCGLSRWPWASSGTAHSVPLCLAQRTAQSAPRQGVGVDSEPVPNRARQAWVDSGAATYAGHTVDPDRYLLSSCLELSSVLVFMHGAGHQERRK